MIPTDIGDPASYAMPSNPNFFPTNLPGGRGRLVVQNDTPYSVDIAIPDGTFRVPSGWARLITVQQVCAQATWQVVTSIAPASSLVSDLYVEAYGFDEDLPEQYPAQIIRQVAIGNQVSTDTGNVIVASKLDLSVTDGLAHTVLTYTPTGTNVYLRLSVVLLNSTASISPNPAPKLTLTYTSPSGAVTQQLLGTSGPSTATVQRYNGTNTFAGVGSWLPVFDTLFRANGGTTVTLTFQDPGGTTDPAYNVSAALELLIQN